jgi:hypothetical protein
MIVLEKSKEKIAHNYTTLHRHLRATATSSPHYHAASPHILDMFSSNDVAAFPLFMRRRCPVAKRGNTSTISRRLDQSMCSYRSMVA